MVRVGCPRGYHFFFFSLLLTGTARRTKKSRSPASPNCEQMVMNLIEDWSRVLGAPNGTVGRQMVQGGGSLRRKVRVVVNEVPRQSGCRQVSTSAGGDNTARQSCRPDPQDALFSNARDCFGRMTRGMRCRMRCRCGCRSKAMQPLVASAVVDGRLMSRRLALEIYFSGRLQSGALHIPQQFKNQRSEGLVQRSMATLTLWVLGGLECACEFDSRIGSKPSKTLRCHLKSNQTPNPTR